MTRRTAIGVVLVVSAWSSSAEAQVAPVAPEAIAIGDWQISPLVELRARGEYRRDVDEDDHALLAERARLGADALHGPLEARIVLQDARALDFAGTTNSVGGASPGSVTGAYEAWGEAHTGGVRPSFVRVGRQPVAWGEGRLLSPADWSPTGRSLDAVRGRLVAGNGAFELLAAVLTDPENGASIQAYGELLGARAEWAFDPLIALDAYVLTRLAQNNPLVSLDSTVRGQTYTGALRLHGDGFGWSWGAEGAYQLGHVEDTNADRVAWAAAGHVGYAFDDVVLWPALRAGVSYATGDGNGTTERAFDPLLSDVHVWHGAMDLFSWSNEEEVNARVSITPWADVIGAVEYRDVLLARPGGFWRTAYLFDVGRAPTNTRSGLGNEVDATLKWSPWEPLSLDAGYSLLVLGDGARAILSANGIGRSQASGAVSTATLAHFAYAQATVRVP